MSLLSGYDHPGRSKDSNVFIPQKNPLEMSGITVIPELQM